MPAPRHGRAAALAAGLLEAARRAAERAARLGIVLYLRLRPRRAGGVAASRQGRH